MNAPKFRKVRNVTLPLFKMEENVEYYFRFDSAMFTGKQIEEKKEPATLVNVLDMQTGEEGQIICPTVLREILATEYPGDSYVGKTFEIIKHLVKAADTGALKYNTFTVTEVAIDDEEAPADEGKKKK